MTFQDAVKKAMEFNGLARVRRREWSPLPWVLSVYPQGDICWSHRSPYTPWAPKWDDLEADDWEIA